MIVILKITTMINELRFLKIYNHFLGKNKLVQAYQEQTYNLGKVFSIISIVFLMGCFNEVSAQEGCEVHGLILNENKGSIENALIISFDSTEYEMNNKLAVIDDIRTAYLAKSDSLNRHSMGVTTPKGEFLFVMGSSKYAIVYHPEYYLKVVDRSKLKSPCNFNLITLKQKQ